MTTETSFGLAFVMLAQKPHALLLSRQWKFTRYLKKTVKFKIMQTLEKLFFYENMKNKAPKFIWSYARDANLNISVKPNELYTEDNKDMYPVLKNVV